MSERTIYLSETELPPSVIYVVWGDADDPCITEYKCPMREGRPIGVKEESLGREEQPNG